MNLPIATFQLNCLDLSTKKLISTLRLSLGMTSTNLNREHIQRKKRERNRLKLLTNPGKNQWIKESRKCIGNTAKRASI